MQDLLKAKHYLDKFIEEASARKYLAADKTDEFLAANEVDSKEASIIWGLVRFQYGHLAYLHLASDNLNSLIDAAKEPAPDTMA